MRPSKTCIILIFCLAVCSDAGAVNIGIQPFIKSLQYSSATIAAGGSTVDVSIDEVDQDNAIIVYDGLSGAVVADACDDTFAFIYFLSDSQVRAARSGSVGANQVVYYFHIIEFYEWAVLSKTASSTTITNADPCADFTMAGDAANNQARTICAVNGFFSDDIAAITDEFMFQAHFYETTTNTEFCLPTAPGSDLDVYFNYIVLRSNAAP